MMTPSLFHDDFDLFERFARDPWFAFDDRDFRDLEKKLYGHRSGKEMKTDIRENDTSYEMIMDLPGFKKEDVTVALDDGYLTISASKSIERGNDQEGDQDSGDKRNAERDRNYIRRERYSGSCQRSFYVGQGLTVEDIKANFQHGILTLTIPKKDQKAIAANKYVAIEG